MQKKDTKRKTENLQELSKTPFSFASLLEYMQSKAGSEKLDNLESKVDKQTNRLEKLESGLEWLKWSLLTGLAAIGLCFTTVFFMIRDTKQDVKELRASTKQDIQKLETDIKEIRTLLIEFIQKQTRTSQK